MELTSATSAASLAIDTQSVLLPILILIPLLGAILLAFVPKEQEAVHRGVGLTFSLIAFFASIPLLTSFDAVSARYDNSQRARPGRLDGGSGRAVRWVETS